MTGATGGENFALGWDWNGNMISTDMASGDDTTLEYNWDNKLRSATKGTDSIALKYDPMGNRIFKDSSESGQRKYIVDIAGNLPIILLEIEPSSGNIMKTYIYANSQILAQHTGKHDQPRYFYLHDRLGSVRQVINNAGAVVNCYTYDPWGLPVGNETQETISNMYRFASYVWDEEISQYHCYRRQYDPVLARFSSRDPVPGSYEQPMTLHKYLYCGNDAINRTDPRGEYWGILERAEEAATGVSAYYGALDVGLELAGGDPWAIMDVAIGVNAARETRFAGGTLGATRGGATVELPGIGDVVDYITNKAERRRGHGFLEDSAQHCWAACYLGVVFGAGSLSAIGEDWPEITRHTADWKRDILAQHYGGLLGDLLHSPFLVMHASSICDTICMTGP